MSYCGVRTYSYVSLSSVEHASPDESIIDFDTIDTFTIDGPLDSHWGHYTVTFGVTLDLYPDFTRQDFTFSLEIVPDCASDTITQAGAIEFAEHYQNFASINLDFSGFFSFSLEGSYNSYCGAIEFILDPSGSPAAQTYLVYDGATALTFAPTFSHAAGSFTHTLRVRVDAYPSVFLDVPFTVDILSCTVTGHYADTFDSEAIDPARTDVIIDYNYIIRTESEEAVFSFTFDDIVTDENDGC